MHSFSQLFRANAMSLSFISLIVFPLACAQPMAPREAAEISAESSDMPSNEVAGLDADRELQLFGYAAPSDDVHFEGRASCDLRQHTTASEGSDFDPGIDPAGQYIVFASTRHAPNSHLYIKPIAGATLTQITDGHGSDTQPVFSPDGNRIAFASNRSGQWDIWTVDRTGRNLAQITNHPTPELHPSWSPDGKHLAFCRINPREAQGELWIVDLQNPGIKHLIGQGLFPNWSPRGDKIAYQRARARGSRWFSIWTVDFMNGEALYPTEVATSESYALIAPAFSRDGNQIAFAAVQPEGHETIDPSEPPYACARIGIVDTDGRGQRIVTDGAGQSFSPAWCDDGRIYFTARLEDSETIWSIRPFQPEPPGDPAQMMIDNQSAAARNDDMPSGTLKANQGGAVE